MTAVTRRTTRFRREAGATAVEYAIMGALIAVVIAAAVALIAPQLIPFFLAVAAAV